MPERFGSPGSLLASFLSRPDETGRLVLVTGVSGAGKSAWCAEFVQQARQGGLCPAGLLSPPVIEAGQKVGIDLMDVATGERRRLANRRDATTPPERLAAVTRGWCFDPDVLDWGNQILQHIDQRRLLVIDELGPMELLENAGFTAAGPLITQRAYGLACVVVRPSLLATAHARWPWHETLQIHGENQAWSGWSMSQCITALSKPWRM